MAALTSKIVEVYIKCGFEPTACPDPLSMLASIEVRGRFFACVCVLSVHACVCVCVCVCGPLDLCL